MGLGMVLGGAIVYSGRNDLKLDYLLSYLGSLLNFTFPSSPSSPRLLPHVSARRKRLHGPVRNWPFRRRIVPRPFRPQVHIVKPETPLLPRSPLFPLPASPTPPPSRKLGLLLGGFVPGLNPFTDRRLSHGNGTEPRTG